MFLLWELDGTTLPMFLLGGFLVFVGIAMGLQQWRAHFELRQDSTLDEREYRDSERHVQIRVTLSGLFLLTGFLISLGGRLDELFRMSAASYFTFSMGFLGGLLMLLAAIVVLGLIDLNLSAAQFRRSANRGSGGRQKLEEELRWYFDIRRGNERAPEQFIETAHDGYRRLVMIVAKVVIMAVILIMAMVVVVVVAMVMIAAAIVIV